MADTTVLPPWQRLAHYDRDHFERGGVECEWFMKRQCLRIDQMNAVAYALGSGAYDPTLPVSSFADQLAYFRERVTTHTWKLASDDGFILSVGEGRGEIAALLGALGIDYWALDPAPGAAILVPETIRKWAGPDAPVNFLPHGVAWVLGLHELVPFKQPPSVVLCSESFEHIPQAEGDMLIGACMAWRCRLVITNAINFHPIKADDTGWNHVRTVDDNLFNWIASASKRLIFRQSSHLVVEF